MSGIVPEMNRPGPHTVVGQQPTTDWTIVRAVARELAAAALVAAGLALVVIAAWSHDPTLGLAALGGSLLVLGLLLGLGS